MKKYTKYFDITYNEYTGESELWILHVDQDDKIYPISWRWNVFSHINLSFVMDYQRRNYKELQQYYKKI